MAVFPDRIVLKTSSNTQAEIIAAISPGGPDAIIPGEMVLGVAPGSVRLYSLDANGTVVVFGSGGAGGASTLNALTDVDVANLADGYVLRWNETDSEWLSEPDLFTTLNDVEDVALNIVNPYSTDGTTAIVMTADAHTIQIPIPEYPGAPELTESNAIGFFTDPEILSVSVSSGITRESGFLKYPMTSQIQGYDSAIRFAGPGWNHAGNIEFESKKGDYYFYGPYDLDTYTDKSPFLVLEAPTGHTFGITVADDLTEDYYLSFPNEDGPQGWSLVSDGNNGLVWQAAAAIDISGTPISALSNVDVVDATNGQGMIYDSAAGEWIPHTFPQEFTELDDVKIMGYDGSPYPSFPRSADGRWLYRVPGIGINNNYYSGFDNFCYWEVDLWGWQMNAADRTSAALGWHREIGLTALHRGDTGAGEDEPYGFFVSGTGEGPGLITIGQWDVTSICDSGSKVPYNTVGITVPADSIPNPYVLTLPTTSGIAGQVLGVDGAGQLDWYNQDAPVGLVDITVTADANGLTFTGGPFEGGVLNPTLAAYVGVAYRFTNNTGTAFTITNLDGSAYADGVTGNGTTTGAVQWRVQQSVPQELKIQVGFNLAVPVAVQGFAANISRNDLGELEDLDLIERPPLEGYALTYEDGKWGSSPMLSAEGQTFIANGIWRPWGTFENSMPGLQGQWTGGTSADNSTNYILFWGVDYPGTSYSSTLDQLIADGTPLWLDLEVETQNGEDKRSTGLIPVEQLRLAPNFINSEGQTVQNLGETYEIIWDNTVAPFPTPANVSPSNNLFKATVRLVERRILSNPVTSVNGLTGTVELGVDDLDDVYVDTLAQLADGFVWASAGQFQQGAQLGDPGTFNYYSDSSDLTIANVDAAGINRRPMALEGLAPAVRLTTSGGWVNLANTSIETTPTTITFKNCDATAQSVFTQIEGVPVRFKFQATQTDGYLLEEDALLQYSTIDQLWKPSALSNVVAGVTSVNGLTGVVDLALQDLTNVGAPAFPIDGQVLTWSESALEWIAATPTPGPGPSVLGGPIITQQQEQQVTTDQLGFATFTGLGNWGNLVSIASDVAAWVCLYTTAAARAADINRAFGDLPTPGSGVLIGFNLAAGQIFEVTPGATYFNNDTPAHSAIYLLARNHDGTRVDGAVIDVKAYKAEHFNVISGGTFGS